jgi:hypothetical protein
MKPPKLGVDIKVGEIKDAIFQVVSEGLAQFISHYEGILSTTTLSRRGADSFAADARQGIADKWTVIGKLICLPIEQLEEKMISTACKNLYADAFQYPGKRRRKALQPADIEMLKREEFFDQWNKEPGSSTLLLTGHNFDQFGKDAGLCWLSSATINIRQDVAEEGQILFYSACRDETSKRIITREPFSNIMSSFVYQVLQWDEMFFEKSFTYVEQELKDQAWTSPSVEKRHRIQGDLLIWLLNSWTESTRIYMIIDRLDKFHGEPDDNPYDLIYEILRIVSKMTCKVKVVITADSLVWGDSDKEINSQWKNWRGDPELTWAKIASIYSRARWHQPEIGRA